MRLLDIETGAEVKPGDIRVTTRGDLVRVDWASPEWVFVTPVRLDGLAAGPQHHLKHRAIGCVAAAS